MLTGLIMKKYESEKLTADHKRLHSGFPSKCGFTIVLYIELMMGIGGR